jgi:3-deoxy-manno-octulosonate cytidylyltransferase (CMP-KDO synthetase)
MSDLLNVVGMIPARYASTRLPGKPLRLILGKPLIQHTFENARKCSGLDALFVATDSQDIADIVEGFHGKAFLTCPNLKSGTDRIAEACDRLINLSEDAIIVNIQGDEPLLEPHVIQRVVEELKQDGTAQMATAITPIHDSSQAEDPSIVKCVRDKNDNALYFSRAKIPPLAGPLYKHIGLYAFRLPFLKTFLNLKPTPLQIAEDLEQLKVLEHGYKMKTALVESNSLGVDTLEDLKKVEKILCNPNTSSSQAESAHP